MARPKPKLPEAQSLYDRDFYAWTQHQAELLRRAAARESTAGLDLDNLAEEIASLGKRDRRALASQIARITERLLKLHYARDEETPPRMGELGRRSPLKGSENPCGQPGLKGDVATLLSESYEDGRRIAARSLRNELDSSTLPEACPYSVDQILDRDWWPPRG